jgi:hypothetical protein
MQEVTDFIRPDFLIPVALPYYDLLVWIWIPVPTSADALISRYAVLALCDTSHRYSDIFKRHIHLKHLAGTKTKPIEYSFISD